MSAIITQPVEDQKQWDEFVSKHPEANFLQSWQWGEFHAAISHQIVRLGFWQGDKLIGVCLGVVEPARRGRYLSIAGGPVLDWHHHVLVDAWSKAVREVAIDHQCVFVRVRPQLLSDEFSKTLFEQMGFREAPMHLSAELTHQLDLRKTEDELLAGMRKQTRYEIRKAGKLGIKLKESTSQEDLRGFYDLQIETAKRQGFVPFSYDFLYEQFKTFARSNMVKLYSAYYDDKLLAQAFVIFYGAEAAYHYGASTELGRKYPGAYAIQWQAICEAKHRGIERYNFWGVAPHDEPEHRFAGVSLFKRGFGGEDVEYLHAQDLVVNKTRYAINLAVEKTRKHLRRV
jgi:lipid II:glycine glycyltransferase (peptidoglycan interpeptide bridge formation enzyme)